MLHFLLHGHLAQKSTGTVGASLNSLRFLHYHSRPLALGSSVSGGGSAQVEAASAKTVLRRAPVGPASAAAEVAWQSKPVQQTT
jgi:hypothetical protein